MTHRSRHSLARMMRRLAVAVGCLAPLPALAQDFVPPVPDIAAMLTGTWSEDLRGVTSPGFGGRLVLGFPLRSQASIELSGFSLNIPTDSALREERIQGGGLDLRLEKLGDRHRTLFLAGGGHSYARRGREQANAPYANIGWGVEYELRDWLGLRAEARGMARFSDRFIEGRGVTYDALFSFGLIVKQRPFAPARDERVFQKPVEEGVADTSPVLQTTGLAEPVVRPAMPLPDQSAAVMDRPADPVPAIVDAPSCPPPQVDARLDATGCLVTQRFTVPRARFFSTLGDKAVSAAGEPVLVALAAVLRRTPDMRVDIAVHTDSVGFADDNIQGTQALANLLRERLLALGADASRIQAEGLGEQSPAASEDTDAGIEKNRRVVFSLSTDR